MAKKRFESVGKDIFQYGEWWCSANGEHCADVIATAINELIEENEQLQEDYDYLEKRFKEEEWHYEHIDEDRDVWMHKCQELEKENEQLKEENKKLQGEYDRQLWLFNGLGCEYDSLKEENEQLKKGMIGVVDRYIKNVDCNPPSSSHTYIKIKGALVNIREDLRDLIEDLK